MKKTTIAFLLALAMALPAAAQTAELRFIPPAPDSRTAVTARIGGMWPDSGYPRCAEVSVAGATITIVAACRPDVVLPAVMPWSLDVFLGILEAGTYDVVVRVDSAAGEVLARATLVVHDAAAAFRVEPNVGTTFDTVRIVAPGLFVCNDTAACAAPVVRFGSIQAEVISANVNEIVVRPPAQSDGRTVDVTVEHGSRQFRVAGAFHYASFDDADATFFEPVLIPVFSSGPGAHGSRWETELSVHNANDFPLTTVPNVFLVGCFPICDSRLPAMGTSIVKGDQRGAGWFVLRVPRQYARNVHFGLLVRDLSRQAEALGTEVPVVREHELYDTAFGILNVPTDARFRVALRLYSMDGAGAAKIVIRPMGDTQPLVNTTLSVPQYLMIGDLVAQYPVLAGSGPLSIEITPDRPVTGRFWGFVSVTNNETQHVTVLTPQ